MTGNNAKLDHVNVDVHIKFGQILSICSQYIEWKLYSDVNQGLLLRQNFAKNDGQQYQARSCRCQCAYKIWSDSVNPKLDLVDVNVHTKFGQILSIGSQDIERK